MKQINLIQTSGIKKLSDVDLSINIREYGYSLMETLQANLEVSVY